MAHPVSTNAFYSWAQTRSRCFHPSGEPTHLPLSCPFCSFMSQGHCQGWHQGCTFL